EQDEHSPQQPLCTCGELEEARRDQEPEDRREEESCPPYQLEQEAVYALFRGGCAAREPGADDPAKPEERSEHEHEGARGQQPVLNGVAQEGPAQEFQRFGHSKLCGIGRYGCVVAVEAPTAGRDAARRRTRTRTSEP